MRKLFLCLTAILVALLSTMAQYTGSAYSNAGYGSAGTYGGYYEAPTRSIINNKQNILNYLSSINYSPYDVPNGLANSKSPLYVLVVLNRISSFVQASSRFTVDLEIYLSWIDPGAFTVSTMQKAMETFTSPLTSTYLDLSQSPNITFDTWSPRQVWFPAVTFPEFRKIEQPDETAAQSIQTLQMLFPNGSNTNTPTLKLWRHVVGDVSCKMDYRKYPFDSNTCPIHIVFPDFDSVKLVSRYSGPAGSIMLNTLSATTSFNGNDVKVSKVYSRGDHSVSSNPDPCVTINVYLKRDGSTYAVTQFIPLCLITMCGLASLWVDPGVPPARIALCITSVLALVAMSFTLTNGLPDSPYLTNTGIFNIICLFFAFITIPAFVIIHTLKTTPPNVGKKKAASKKKKEAEKDEARDLPPPFSPPQYYGAPEFTQAPQESKKEPTAPPAAKSKTPLWKTVDNICKYAIPIGFLISITVFFPVTTTLR